MKKVIFLVLLSAFVLNINSVQARRIKETNIHKFFQTEPTKQLTIGIDFSGTIAFNLGNQWKVREGMLDFLRELKARGHKVVLFTGTFYEECIKAAPELENIVDGYRGKGYDNPTSEFDFIIDDDSMLIYVLKQVAKSRGENPDKCIEMPRPLDYDYEHNPFGWVDKIVELIQDAGG